MNPAMKKMGVFMTVSMGVTVSLVLATYGVVQSGHFTIGMWVISAVLSVIIALVIGFALPIRAIAEKATASIKHPVVRMLADTAIVNLFYCLIITTVLECVMLGLANQEITKGQEAIQNRIVALESDAELNKQEIIGLKNQMEGMEQARPSVWKTLPMSLVMSYIIAYIVCLIVQPIYKTIGVKRFLQKKQ